LFSRALFAAAVATFPTAIPVSSASLILGSWDLAFVYARIDTIMGVIAPTARATELTNVLRAYPKSN